MKKVLLINQGKSSENLGDKAIAETFKKVLNENGCSVTLAGFSQTKDVSMSEIDISNRKSFKSLINSKFKRIVPSIFVWFFKYKKKIKQEYIEKVDNHEYDLVIIGGGQLLKTKSVFVYALLNWYVLLKKNSNCPIVIAGVGADTTYTKLESLIYKNVLNNIDEIYVRDHKSIKVLNDKFNINAKYFPDIVLYDFQEESMEKSNVKRNKLLVSIFSHASYVNNIKENISKHDYYDIWIKLIKENVEEELEVILGYTTITDKRETIQFAEYLEKHGDIDYKIVNNDNLNDYNETVKVSKKIISGRMHGMLIGLNNCCEIIPFEVSPKIKTFKKEWLDVDYDKYEISSTINKSIREIICLQNDIPH